MIIIILINTNYDIKVAYLPRCISPKSDPQIIPAKPPLAVDLGTAAAISNVEPMVAPKCY